MRLSSNTGPKFEDPTPKGLPPSPATSTNLALACINTITYYDASVNP